MAAAAGSDNVRYCRFTVACVNCRDECTMWLSDKHSVGLILRVPGCSACKGGRQVRIVKTCGHAYATSTPKRFTFPVRLCRGCSMEDNWKFLFVIYEPNFPFVSLPFSTELIISKNGNFMKRKGLTSMCAFKNSMLGRYNVLDAIWSFMSFVVALE